MAASSSASTCIPVGYNRAVRITVCHLDGRENHICLHLDLSVMELHNNVARIESIADDSFQIVCKHDNDDHVTIMDPAKPLSEYIQVFDPVVTLVKLNTGKANSEHLKCISCLKPFTFWKTEMVCRACYMQQVHAARVYGLDGL